MSRFRPITTKRKDTDMGHDTQQPDAGTRAGIGFGGLVRALRVSEKLIETRDGVKRLLGDKWPDKVCEIRPAIEALMEDEGSDNVLKTVLPVAKEMSDDGHSPVVLLAVACEMVEPSCPNAVHEPQAPQKIQ